MMILKQNLPLVSWLCFQAIRCSIKDLARYDAKIIPPLYVSLNSSVTRPSFEKSDEQLFDQVAKDVKSVF